MEGGSVARGSSIQPFSFNTARTLLEMRGTFGVSTDVDTKHIVPVGRHSIFSTRDKSLGLLVIGGIGEEGRMHKQFDASNDKKKKKETKYYFEPVNPFITM